MVNRLRVVFLLVVLVCPSVHAEWLSAHGEAMGTEISLELWHDDPAVGQQAADAVMAEMQRIDNAFSPWKPDSELAQLNAQAAKAPQPVSDELTFLLERALFYSHLTEGAFDITFASVGRHYDYRTKKAPTDTQTKSLLPAVDYRHIDLASERNLVSFKHPDVQVDLGGIAKGYAVDRAAQILQDHEITHAAVSAGGDTRVLGDRRGRPWMMGIKKPRSLTGDDEPAVVLPLQEAALSTSGDYERYFINPTTGERIHHIINPRTGRSASGPVSVSVIGREGIDTDALSTSVFVLGVARGLALIEDLPGFDAIIIDSSGQLHFSSGLIDPTAPAEPDNGL
jgi:thiamine biosynthesis lipoprotein